MRNYFFALALIACCLYVYKLFAHTIMPKDYIVVSSYSISELEREVESKISFGYQPVGGVSANGRYVYQAMIK